MNRQERVKSSDITNEELKGNGNGWDSSRCVDENARSIFDDGVPNEGLTQ